MGHAWTIALVRLRHVRRAYAGGGRFGASAATAGGNDGRQQHTIITVGGGAQLLSLPDINFTFFVKNGDAAVRTQKNSDLDDYGGAFVGSIETPLGYWGATPVTGVVSGLFANVEDTEQSLRQLDLLY
jgi:hypothetical protein